MRYRRIVMWLVFGLCASGACPEPIWLQGVLNEMDLASFGANRVLNVLYQRCDASNILVDESVKMLGYNEELGSFMDDHGQSEAKVPPEKLYDLHKVAASGNHPYLSDSYGPSCRDMRLTPPVFHMEGRAHIKETKNSYELNLFNSNWRDLHGVNHQSNFITYECSGLVSASYAAAGLKFSTKGTMWEQTQVTTAALAAVGHPSKSTDCLEVAEFSKSETIKNGDIVLFRMKALPEGHSAIIDSVGPDPFALSDIHSLEECTSTSINTSKFDFNLIVAGTSHARVAAIKTKAGSFIRYEEWGPLLQEMAFSACRAKFSPQEASAETTAIGSAYSRILRHVGRKNPACFYGKPVTLVGEACVERCNETTAP